MYSLLIVDDEPHIIEGVKVAINWNSFGVTKIFEATDFNDAIQKAIDVNPDIAILDIRIHTEWGYDIVKTLKQFGIKTKCIMISGYDSFEYIHRSLREGAKDYLLKPIDYLELKRIVRQIIIEDLGGKFEEDISEDDSIDPILGKAYKEFTKLTNRVLAMIHNDYQKNITLISVADIFKMNNRYIGQAFLSETGMKFSEYLLAYRMMLAKKMLIDTDEKMTYIAYRVGYSNMNYFYQHFKAYFGMSPSDMRVGKNLEGGDAK